MITSASVHCSWAECLPYNCLTDISSNEERNARAKTIAFLQKFIQQKNYQTSNKKLQGEMYNISITSIKKLLIKNNTETIK